jgi:uncharacterized membrane protein YphA (DoxX/SURF4 family)
MKPSALMARVCAVVLSIIFLVAALSKIGDLGDFQQSLARIAFLPAWLQSVALLFIPGLELALAIALALPSLQREGAALAAGLLVLFLIFGITLNLTGSLSDCGCFKLPLPTWLNLSGWWIVARNLLFLIMTGLVLWSKSPLPAKQPI